MVLLPTLVHLRWLAVGCQLILLAAIEITAPGSVPWGAAAAMIAILAGSNALLAWRPLPADVGPAAPTAVLAFDIGALMVVLALALGPGNPFTALYLVIVAIGAMVLPRGHAALLVVVAMAAYGALFLVDPTPEPMHHGRAMRLHLVGMWVAFAVAAPFVAYAIASLRQGVSDQERELQSIRDRAARQQRLASLATLATGAAHELSTPLATIAVVARELERGAHPDDAADAALIRAEVERCTDILRRLAAHTGQSVGDELVAVPVVELVQRACQGLDEGPDVVWSIDEAVCVCVPVDAMARALRGLVDNALDASAPDVPVQLTLGVVRDDTVELQVIDEGHGIEPELLSRVGEPFYTTKDTEGMGLGVFYARSLLEQIGGDLDLTSAPGRGTTATLTLPRGER